MKHYWLEKKNVAWKCTTVKFNSNYMDRTHSLEVAVELTDGRKYLCWADKRVLNSSRHPDMYVWEGKEWVDKFNDPWDEVEHLRRDIADKIAYNVLLGMKEIDKNEDLEEYHKTVNLGTPGTIFYGY